jgi:hypothetical protein
MLFSDGGRREHGGRRARLRSPSGFELHAVREYREGEPLRAVHWASTARRDQLMVKDMDDAPRDDVVVVLDQDPGALAGERGSSSFDAAVRAAGSIVRAHASRGRRVSLLLSGADPEVVRVRSLGDWAVALDARGSRAGRRVGCASSPTRACRRPRADLVVVTGNRGGRARALQPSARRTARRPRRRRRADLCPGRAVPGEPGPPPRAGAGVSVAVVRAGRGSRGAALAGAAPEGRAVRSALVVSLPPSLAVAFAWSRLESGPADWRMAVAVALGLAAAVLTTWTQRFAALLVGLILTSSLGFSAWPGGDGAWPGDVLAGAEKGLRDFYTVALPFDASAHHAMQGLVLVVVFALTGALALASAWGRPLACSALAAVGVCWAARSSRPGHRRDRALGSVRPCGRLATRPRRRGLAPPS